jgi:hypothetical protein
VRRHSIFFVDRQISSCPSAKFSRALSFINSFHFTLSLIRFYFL